MRWDVNESTRHLSQEIQDPNFSMSIKFLFLVGSKKPI